MSILTPEDYSLIDCAIDILKDYTTCPELLINTIYLRLAKEDYTIIEQLIAELQKIYSYNLTFLRDDARTIPPMIIKLESLSVTLDFRANGSELGFVEDDEELRQSNKEDKKTLCNFCKKNGERSSVYSSHTLKNKFGFVTCPILQKYKCPICNATGFFAHTLKYCSKFE